MKQRHVNPNEIGDMFISGLESDYPIMVRIATGVVIKTWAGDTFTYFLDIEDRFECIDNFGWTWVNV